MFVVTNFYRVAIKQLKEKKKKKKRKKKVMWGNIFHPLKNQ
jgi:hypothetical protein